MPRQSLQKWRLFCLCWSHQLPSEFFRGSKWSIFGDWQQQNVAVLDNSPTNKVKGHPEVAFYFIGGAGGIWTPVRKTYVFSTTCLSIHLVNPRSAEWQAIVGRVRLVLASWLRTKPPCDPIRGDLPESQLIGMREGKSIYCLLGSDCVCFVVCDYFFAAFYEANRPSACT